MSDSLELFNAVALQHLMTYVPTYGVGTVRSGSGPISGSPVLLMQCASDVLTLTSGAFTIPFPETFPNGVVCVICTGGDSAAATQWLVSTVTTSGCSGTAYGSGGATTSGSVRVDYIALGF
jgi:hypothetical protein